MDKHFLIDFNLMEAEAHLIELKEKFKKYQKIDDFDLIDWQIRMQHIMAHLNKAYNIRELTNEQIAKLSDEQMNDLSQTPNNLIHLIS